MRDTHMHIQTITKPIEPILSKHLTETKLNTTLSANNSFLSHLLSGIFSKPLNDIFQLSVTKTKTADLLDDIKHVDLNTK